MKRTLLLLCLTLSCTVWGNFYFTNEMIGSHLKGYNEEEKSAIAKDLHVVRSVCFPSNPPLLQFPPVYIATAGGPGARKSTILERFLKEHPEYKQVIYLDPDQRGLKFMVNTYVTRSLNALTIAEFENYGLAVKSAYEKWRGGSNWIAVNLLEKAFLERRNIAHGTTSTGDHITTFFPTVKDAGYKIVLLLCSCEDSFRKEAITYRNNEQKLYQSTPEDAVIKGRIFPERMKIYFEHADTLYLYWSTNLKEKEKVAAVCDEGLFSVVDQQAFDLFKRKYEEDRFKSQKEGKSLPTFAELIKIYENRFV